MRWFPFLVADNPQGLLKHVRFVPNETLVVCRESHPEGRKNFGLFSNYFEFYDFLFNESGPNGRFFYELILEGCKQKAYLDMDYTFSEAEERETVEKREGGERIVSFANSFASFVADKCGVPKNTLTPTIYSSHGSRKLSFHVVLSGGFFRNHLELKELVSAFSNELKPEFPFLVSMIDQNVYKKTQQLRILGCSKFSAQDRIKKRIWPPLSPDVDTNKILLFLHSLITFVISSDLPLSFLIKERTAKPYSSSSCSHIPLKVITSILEKNGIETDCLEIDGRNRKGGNIYPMRRLKPNFCKLCNRIHESENPFLVVSEIGILFKCRRSSEGLKMAF